MKLYGTTTSPFVRRVRVVAHELGVPVELVSTASEAGFAAMSTLTPIGKVPIAVIDGRTVFDSHVIIDRLIAAHGTGGLAAGRDGIDEANRLSAIDALVEAALSLFYLRRDQVPIAGSPYERRQLDRVTAILTWLDGQLTADGRGFGAGLGLTEIALVTSLDWMAFRDVYPADRFGRCGAVRSAWADRPSFAASPPMVTPA